MENFTVSSSPSFHGNISRRRYSFNGSVQTGLASNSPTNIPPPKHHLEEPPFSTYLGAPPGSQQSYKKPVVTRKSFDENENEISIFAAEKYFNETQPQQQSKENKLSVPSSSTATHVNNEKNDNKRIVESDEYAMQQIERNSSVSSSVVDGYEYGKKYRTRSVQSTTTVSSEASWNSQSGLLYNLPRGSINGAAMRNNNLNSEQGKKSRSQAKWIFGRKCCFGRKSVQVQENLSEPSKIHNLHTHQVLNTGFHLNSMDQRPKTGEIDVYKPPSLNEGTNKFEFEKNLKGNDGRDKQELPYRNAEKENEVSGHSAHFAPENKFTVEIGCPPIPPGRSFHDVQGFSFPAVLNPLIVGKPLNQLNSSTREILESIPLPDSSIRRKSNEIQQRKLMSPSLAHDHHQSFNLPVSRKPQTMIKDEDIESDTSSDLFEIESISTQTTSYPIGYQQRDYNYLEEEISSYKARRQSLDEPTTPSVAPTELYEPSETSINWSVTTAEGIDRVSFTNFSVGAASPTDYEEAQFFMPSNANSTTGGGGGRPRVNGLLGCRSENSVKVDLNPVKHVEELQPRKCYDYIQSFRVETDRIQALSKFANISSTDVKRSSIIKPPLPGTRSRSSQTYSHAFTTR